MKDELPNGLPRIVEIGIAVLGILITFPLLVLAALLIRFGSAGPVIFRQQRVGRHGRVFNMYKLRTMRPSVEGALVTSADDRRITGIGKLLRRTKIDELPELWNVIIGDMRIVGPRPEVPKFVDLSDTIWNEILSCRPGITDPVTLRLRNEEQLLTNVVDKERYYREVVQPYKLRGYIRYLRNRSWKSDIRIMLRTAKAILHPKSAGNPSKEELQLSFAE